MDHACTYCGCDVREHDPVYVEEMVDGERVPAGRFCNYACLTAHVEEAGLTTDACCTVDYGEGSDGSEQSPS